MSGAQALSGLFPGSFAGENLYKFPRELERECRRELRDREQTLRTPPEGGERPERA